MSVSHLEETVQEKRYSDLTVGHKDDILAAIESMIIDPGRVTDRTRADSWTAHFSLANQWSDTVSVAKGISWNFLTTDLDSDLNDFSVFDKKQHNNGTNDSPSSCLILGFSYDYHLDNMTEENITDVADGITDQPLGCATGH